jgi:hypothetical protein
VSCARFRRRLALVCFAQSIDPKESKMADQTIQGTQRPAGGQQPPEERGIVNEVVVPIVATAIGGAATGAAGAAVTHLLKKKDK